MSILVAADLRTTRATAKATIDKLIEVHRQTIADIEAGKEFWRRGENVSDDMRKRCRMEIKACLQVLQALDHMNAGDIKRAADLCSQIQEHLPRVD
jgi:DNA-binding XRE family transcriptional regulator